VERAVWQCEALGGGQRAMRKCGEFCDGSEKAANSSAEGESLASAVCLVTKIRDGGAYINCQGNRPSSNPTVFCSIRTAVVFQILFSCFIN
jgi:hypothetical protein